MKNYTVPNAMEAGLRRAQEPEWFDFGAVAGACEHAIQVYLSADMWVQQVASMGYERPVLIDRGATEVGVARCGNLVVVANRGSSEFLDWVDDASACFAQWEYGGRVHAGFRRQLRRVRDDLLTEVVSAVRRAQSTSEGTPLVCVLGHSLGGGLVGPSLDLLTPSLQDCQLVGMTYNAPRTGDRDYAERQDREHVVYRMVNVWKGSPDIVSRLPRSIYGYWHSGRLRLCHEAGVEVGSDAWERYREKHPVGWFKEMRFVSKLLLSIRAHSAPRALAVLHQVRMAAARGGAESGPTPTDG